MSLSVLIAAGGTGGHMISAHALSDELMRRGHKVTLLTDARGLRFPGLFEFADRHVLESATASGFNPVAWVKALLSVWKGRSAGKRIAREAGADAVVGFGGYPSLPGLLAGVALGLPSLIHEQNAVLGRVNGKLQGRVSRIALSYAKTAGLSAAAEAKSVHTGNPVREAILAARDAAFEAPAPGEPFRLLVVGGSQGARILSQMVPAAIADLPEVERRRLKLVQQCRVEDLSAVDAAYREAGIDAECVTYLEDFPRRLAQAHLVVGRAGASTMAELMAMGRPAILIPFAAATDDHQTANAAGFVSAGAGFTLVEAEATPAKLTGLLKGFMEAPEALQQAAAAAKGLGIPDAAARLADLVEKEVRAA
ncbi:UDP-N-acetylglucosamine--N-acetylmuramyl-(pentapeptide) pyrophosphoryl-undecaprenol N-acetylglucosamine transferase [Sandaracinobacter sp. RS1-74]|uniref:UDP-N-acetylglucosamine--N-acetylmuramyl- (pentapeptide) pyrophosphoryl-undecaprenol N-acetylglucosamine transferase n=1 Tax=Sandaracinobacteroides sayramensis TaxID=2913411 RepID=UPI001EDAE97F|nr:UDP-N-acetylglucosamine--N-acetylmuramyl-(pentapeptide) pyrophosphoryl-undecaprenol N-acetylglucosamine transferase [Sandaracinobacteroides sayramensis]MCG2840475.1 UDP-N-acetylglucosamine--N-acetylmuramyl-(pentapeptide) pyrophosphoryl-undecaprenol N-acetylglucosamine transferase [Sandaracinobacteroides sayramensis]